MINHSRDFIKRLTRAQTIILQPFFTILAERIDVYVGDIPPGKEVTHGNAKFAHLGYVNLAENEASSFKARELKSITLEATGTFVKLSMHKNYMNKLNMYNQVMLYVHNCSIKAVLPK